MLCESDICVQALWYRHPRSLACFPSSFFMATALLHSPSCFPLHTHTHKPTATPPPTHPHTPHTPHISLQETPDEFLALLGSEAPSFQDMPAAIDFTRSAFKLLTHPPASEQQQAEGRAEGEGEGKQGDGGEAAAAAAGDGAGQGDVMQQDGQQQQQENGGQGGQGGDAAAAAAGNGGEGGEGAAMDVDEAAPGGGDGNGEQQQQEQDEAAADGDQDPIALWSGRLLGVLQARYNPDHKPLTTAQVLTWFEQQQVSR